MRSRSSCSCRERDSRDKLQSSSNTSLHTNTLRLANNHYPPVVRPPAASQLHLDADGARAHSMSLSLQEQQHNHASFEAQELELAIERAAELRALIRASLLNLQQLPSLAADQLFRQAVVDANHELAGLEEYVADSPDRGQRYGLELPFSDDSDDAEMAAEAIQSRSGRAWRGMPR